MFDNDSKFGTLIQLQKDYEILNEKTAVQIERTVFTLLLKRQRQQDKL